jgi:hypothetical protein
MKEILVDDGFKHAIAGVLDEAAVRDSAGNILGWFTPIVADSKRFSGPTVSDGELRRRAVSTEKCYSTAEVLAYLKSL